MAPARPCGVSPGAARLARFDGLFKLLEHFVGRIVLDADHHPFATATESWRQPLECLGGDRFERVEGGGFQRSPSQRVGMGFVIHSCSIVGDSAAIHLRG